MNRKSFHSLSWVIVMLLAITPTLLAEDKESGLAGPTLDPSERRGRKELKFSTDLRYAVGPSIIDYFLPVEPDEWPELPAPVVFNPHFEKPKVVWKTPQNGFFASFHHADSGGALFWANSKSKKWTKVVDGIFYHLEGYDKGVFIAVGGIRGTFDVSGYADLIRQNDGGVWESETVFRTRLGPARIVGVTAADPNNSGGSERLVVLDVLGSPKGPKPIFGVNRDGTVHYLGRPTTP